jgi:hypothetical protein
MYTIKDLQKSIDTNDIKLAEKILAEKNINLNINYTFILTYALKNNAIEILKMLIKEEHIDLANMNNSLLRDVVQMNNYELAKLLMTYDSVNPADFMQHCILNAVKNNNIQMVKLLLEDERVNPAYNEDIFFYAIKDGDRNNIRDLLWNDYRFKKADKSSFLNSIAEHCPTEMLIEVLNEREYESNFLSYLLFFANVGNNISNIHYLWHLEGQREKLQEFNPDEYEEISTKALQYKLAEF